MTRIAILEGRFQNMLKQAVKSRTFRGRRSKETISLMSWQVENPADTRACRFRVEYAVFVPLKTVLAKMRSCSVQLPNNLNRNHARKIASMKISSWNNR